MASRTMSSQCEAATGFQEFNLEKWAPPLGYLNSQRAFWSELKQWFCDLGPSIWIFANWNYENRPYTQRWTSEQEKGTPGCWSAFSRSNHYAMYPCCQSRKVHPSSQGAPVLHWICCNSAARSHARDAARGHHARTWATKGWLQQHWNQHMAACHFRGVWWRARAVPYPFRGYVTGRGTGYGTLWRVADPR